MKKAKLFLIALGLFGVVLFATPKQNFVAKAEEEIVEVVEDEEEDIVVEDSKEVEENNEEIVEEQPATNDTTLSISQVANDTIAVLNNFFNQPIVIFGFSTTLGALTLLIIAKAVSFVKKGSSKAVKELTEKLTTTIENCKEYASKKDYDNLKAENKQLKAILSEIIPTIKNIHAKENCVALMESLKEDIEEVKEVAVEKVEEHKSEILDFLYEEDN